MNIHGLQRTEITTYKYFFQCTGCYAMSPTKDTEAEAIEAAKKTGVVYDGDWTCRDCATGKTDTRPAVCPDCHRRQEVQSGEACPCGHIFGDEDFLTPAELDPVHWQEKLTRWAEAAQDGR